MARILSYCTAILLSAVPLYAYAALSCSITTAAGCTGTVILRMSTATNAHAELPAQSTPTYANNVICCSGSQTIGTSCAGTHDVVLSLDKVTNAHVQQNDQVGYSNNACISVAAGSVSIAYQDVNCSGYDTTLASISSANNAQIGNTGNYTTKVCGSENGAVAQSLSFSLSTSTIYLGTLSSTQTRYASSTGQGDSVEVSAHTLAVNTNATNGYTVTIQGGTLTSQQNSSHTITAIGGSNTSPSIGSEQFGIRLTASGGVGAVTVPYAASGFAFAASTTTPSEVASAASGDSATTTYSIRYMSNISAVTEPGSYTTSVVYIITANF